MGSAFAGGCYSGVVFNEAGRCGTCCSYFAGDGFRAGFQGDTLKEGVVKSSSYLKRIMSDRKTTRPPMKEWQPVLLNSEPIWVQYKGLWGVKSLLNEESGPPGPKWDRPMKDQIGVNRRVRWDKPLDWLAELEKHSYYKVSHAFQTCVINSEL